MLALHFCLGFDLKKSNFCSFFVLILDVKVLVLNVVVLMLLLVFDKAVKVNVMLIRDEFTRVANFSVNCVTCMTHIVVFVGSYNEN